MLEKLPVKTIPLPTPFPVGDINSYLFTADPVTIIDPGLYYPPAERALARALDRYGLKMSDLKRIVITHGHPDHYGMAGKIQGESGAEILVRDSEAGKIKPGRGFIDSMAQSFRTTGITEEILKLNWIIVFGANVPYTHPIDSMKTYSGEPELEFSGFSLKLLHMPGHSGGHTCLYWEEERLLLSGDLLLPEITAIPSIEYDRGRENMRRQSLSEMLGSLERIRSLNPALCLPGHGNPITGPGKLAKSRIDFHEGRLEEIVKLVPRGVEREITPYRLSRAYYPDVKGFDKFLAVIEVVSHMDLLADRGRIEERIDERGVSHFCRTTRE